MVIGAQQITGGGGGGHEEAKGEDRVLDNMGRDGPRRQERPVKVRKVSSQKGVCILFSLKFSGFYCGL